MSQDTRIENVRDVFNQYCQHVVFDKVLVKKILRMKNEFITRNNDHANFFGSNLLGCYVVRFLPGDRERVFSELLEVDERTLKKPLNRFIDSDKYKVAGDPYNLACVWLAHRLYTSDQLSEEEREVSVISILEMMMYKLFTSRYYIHYRYACSVDESKALLASLNNKFAIKTSGSWYNYFYDRALILLDKEKQPIHNHILEYMDKDTYEDRHSYTHTKPSVVYFISHLQTKIREMLLTLYDQHLKIRKEGLKINSSKGITSRDGEMELRDQSGHDLVNYSNYIQSILPDKGAFIKPDMVRMINKIMPTASDKIIVKGLEYLSNNYHINPDIQITVSDIISHAVGYLSRDNLLWTHRKDIEKLILTLKGTYTASRNTDNTYIEVKDKVEFHMKTAGVSKAPAYIAAARTAVMLYIMLRIFLKD